MILNMVQENLLYIVVGLSAFSVFLFLLCLIALIKLSLTKKRLNAFLRPKSEKHNIEAMLIDYLEEVKAMNRKHQQLLDNIKSVDEKLMSNLNSTEVKLTSNLNSVESKLTSNINSVDSRISDNLNNIDNKYDNAVKNLFNKLDTDLKNTNAKFDNEVNKLDERLRLCIQKVGAVRYNPFDEVGGELCFAVAMLDHNNDGVVLNSVYTREGCYVYAKPIENCECEKYKLSSEEKEAIERAVKENPLAKDWYFNIRTDKFSPLFFKEGFIYV